MLLASFLSRNPVSWKAALFPVNQVVTSSPEVMTFYPVYFHQEKCKFYRAKQTGIFLWTIGMKPAHLFVHEKYQVNIMLWSWGSSSSKPTWDPLAQKLGFGFHGGKKFQTFLHLQVIQLCIKDCYLGGKKPNKMAIKKVWKVGSWWEERPCKIRLLLLLFPVLKCF